MATVQTQTYRRIEVQTEDYQAGQYKATPEGHIVRAKGHLHLNMAIRLEPLAWWEAKTFPMASPLPGNYGHTYAKAMWSNVTNGQMRAIQQILELAIPYRI